MKSYLILFPLVSLLISSGFVKAQEAYKFKETTYLRCDLGEMLTVDDFISEMQQKPKIKGFIIVYGIKGTALRYATHVRDRTIQIRGLNPERVFAYYGGFADKSRMEFWLSSAEGKEPQVNPIVDERDSSKFDEYGYWRGEYCENPRTEALKLFAQELKQRPNWQGYIIVYASKEDKILKLSLRQAERRAVNDRTFINKLGLKKSRIIPIVGGYSDWSHAELWLVPPGAKPPKPTAQK